MHQLIKVKYFNLKTLNSNIQKIIFGADFIFNNDIIIFILFFFHCLK